MVRIVNISGGVIHLDSIGKTMNPGGELVFGSFDEAVGKAHELGLLRDRKRIAVQQIEEELEILESEDAVETADPVKVEDDDSLMDVSMLSVDDPGLAAEKISPKDAKKSTPAPKSASKTHKK
jgi:hypothetical protein